MNTNSDFRTYDNGTIRAIAAATQRAGSTGVSNQWGSWGYTLCYVNRTAATQGVITQLGKGELTGLGAMGDLTVASPFTIGDHAIVGGSRGQIAWAGAFVGADAEELSNNWIANYESPFWTHNQDPNGLIDTSSGFVSERSNDRISASKTGGYDGRSVIVGYDAAAVNENKMAANTHVGAGTETLRSLDFTTGATWVKTNLTASTTEADYDTSTRDFLESQKLTADANGGQMVQTFTSTTPTAYTAGIFYKRHSGEGSDVGMHLGMIDDPTGTPAEIGAGLDLTATDTWQWASLEVASLSTSTGVLASIDTSGESICLDMVTVIGANFVFPVLNTTGAVTSAAAVYDIVGTAGQYCKGATGEIAMRLAGLKESVTNDRNIMSVWRAADDKDKRQFVAQSADQKIKFRVYDNVPAENSALTAATVAKNVSFSLIGSWDNTVNLKVKADANEGTTAATWDATDLTDTVTVGGNEGSPSYDASFETLTIYDKPR